MKGKVVYDASDQPEYSVKVCALCGVRPQTIGVHCGTCYNELADAAFLRELNWEGPTEEESDV